MRKNLFGVSVCLGALAGVLSGAFCLPAQADPLYGKYVGKSAIREQAGTNSDVYALKAVEAIKIPINTPSTLYEYTSAVMRAKSAIELAQRSEAPGNIELLKAAIDKHLLAIEFMNECSSLKNNRPKICSRSPQPLSQTLVCNQSAGRPASSRGIRSLCRAKECAETAVDTSP